MSEENSVWARILMDEESSLVKALFSHGETDKANILQRIEPTPSINKRIKKRYEINWDILISNDLHQLKASTINISTTGVLIDRLIRHHRGPQRPFQVMIRSVQPNGEICPLYFKAILVQGLNSQSCRLMFVSDQNKSWKQLETILKEYEISQKTG